MSKICLNEWTYILQNLNGEKYNVSRKIIAKEKTGII